MVVTVSITEIIAGLVILSIIVYTILSILLTAITNIFKKNCYECKHYYLKDVASYGDACWYGCDINKDIHDQQTMNSKSAYRKCNKYEHRIGDDDTDVK